MKKKHIFITYPFLKICNHKKEPYESDNEIIR